MILQCFFSCVHCGTWCVRGDTAGDTFAAGGDTFAAGIKVVSYSNIKACQ